MILMTPIRIILLEGFIFFQISPLEEISQNLKKAPVLVIELREPINQLGAFLLNGTLKIYEGQNYFASVK
jgi:hypothetical protein